MAPSLHPPPAFTPHHHLTCSTLPPCVALKRLMAYECHDFSSLPLPRTLPSTRARSHRKSLAAMTAFRGEEHTNLQKRFRFRDASRFGGESGRPQDSKKAIEECEGQTVSSEAVAEKENKSGDAYSALSQVRAVLGTQWSDEGKDKLVDILVQRYDVVAGCQLKPPRWYWNLLAWPGQHFLGDSTLMYMRCTSALYSNFYARDTVSRTRVFACKDDRAPTYLNKKSLSSPEDVDDDIPTPTSTTKSSSSHELNASSESEGSKLISTSVEFPRLGTNLSESLDPSTSSNVLPNVSGFVPQDEPFSPFYRGRKKFKNRFLVLTKLGTTIQKSLESFFRSEIRQRTIMTVLMLMAVRAGHFIPLPGFDRRFMSEDYLAYVSGALEENQDSSSELRLSLFQLGIGPYIGASIIMQVLCYVVPHLVRLRKEGSEGIKRIKTYTERLAFLLAVVQALIVALQSAPYSLYEAKSRFGYLAVTTTLLSVGAMLIHWVCDKISDSGFGQGPSLYICVSILSGYADSLYKVISSLIYEGQHWGPSLFALFGFSLCFTICAVLTSAGHRKVKLQYYNFELSPSTGARPSLAEVEPYIPFSISPTGMQPLLATTIIMQLPGFLARLTRNGFWIKLKEALTPGTNPWFSQSVTIFFIFLFNILDLGNIPVEVNQYLMKIGARIPKIKPGYKTIEYLSKVQASTRFWGGLMLSLLVVASTMVDNQFRHLHQGGTIGFTSMLIIVGAILDLRRTFMAYKVMPSLSKVLKRFDS